LVFAETTKTLGRKGAEMLIIGCDFHPRFQQIAYVDQQSGEYGERRLCHCEEATQFYRSLAGKQVCIGLEATGNYRWFGRLLAELGLAMLVGDPGAIHAAMARRQKTDRRDARHLLQLLVEGRFPAVWQPPAENLEMRQLLLHRWTVVRLRTRVTNQLDGLAKNEGLLGPRVWRRKRRQQVEALPLSGWYARRRQDLLQLLDELNRQLGPLDKAVAGVAEQNPEARRLMTHPGVGPIVALAYVLAIGDWQRFPRGKQVASYLGLIPAEASSSDKRRLGHISKQGNGLVRWLLVEAASIAQRYDPAWHRQYLRLSMSKHHGVAKVAMAHKLAIRLYWMLRSGQDYPQLMERGWHAGQSADPTGCSRQPKG
jgi:transposase